MTHNNQKQNNRKQKQKDTQLFGKNATDVELGQELGSIRQEISQLSQSSISFFASYIV
ncbi:hypothetical protein [Priestia endophytica]|jgi:hypothetical protein|uniref:t-SNARE coiled-coil homology domain-containing protein n=1 Tax=Priestia endophytica DSM 13796 TaxID=1121089 RepID=A0A1I6C8G7_9BACI|nr:hypothetical protein [Priestia endophytica]SFQ89500.1 hypothetical protein SAMN02745910_05290 [Priestia endophytica DSM 13796]